MGGKNYISMLLHSLTKFLCSPEKVCLCWQITKSFASERKVSTFPITNVPRGSILYRDMRIVKKIYGKRKNYILMLLHFVDKLCQFAKLLRCVASEPILRPNAKFVRETQYFCQRTQYFCEVTQMFWELTQTFCKRRKSFPGELLYFSRSKVSLDNAIVL